MEDPLDFHPPLDGFRFVDVIGRGGFGLVKLARHLASGKYVAVKILLRDCSPSMPLSAQGEAAILRSLRHDNIVRLLEERHTRTHLFLVMELATKGSLHSYVFEQGGLAEAEARTLFGQALAAVSYCHAQRVVHRDLKLGNLLLDEHMTIKLADFGLSLRLEQGTLVRGFWGTPEYCAPEVFLGEAYDAFKADVWSLGVVLFAMLAATLPFRGKDTEELLAWLLTVDTSGRPSAEDATTHWWLDPGQEATQEEKEAAVTLLQPLGVPRDSEAKEYLAGLGLLPGTGTEGTPVPQPQGPASLPESSQGGERHPTEKDRLSLVSVSCESMSVNISSARSHSSEASSQLQQERSPAPSATPNSSQASSQPQQEWSPIPSTAPEPASEASPSSPSAGILMDLAEPEATTATAREPKDADTTDTKASAQGKAGPPRGRQEDPPVPAEGVLHRAVPREQPWQLLQSGPQVALPHPRLQELSAELTELFLSICTCFS